MFEESLLESGKKYQRRSPWVTAFSFLMQVLLIGVLVLIPILYPEALPKQQFMTFLVAPPPPPPPPPPAAVTTLHVQKVISELDNGQLRTPTAIPKKIAKIQEEDTPAPSGGVVGGVIGGLPGGAVGGVLGGVLNSIASSVPAAVPKVAMPQKVRVSSGVAQGNLIHDVRPPYPPLARQAHSRHGGHFGHNRQRWHDSASKGRQWTPDAGAGRARGGKAMALQALLPERRTGQRQHDDQRQFQPFWWVELAVVGEKLHLMLLNWWHAIAPPPGPLYVCVSRCSRLKTRKSSRRANLSVDGVRRFERRSREFSEFLRRKTNTCLSQTSQTLF